MDDAQQPTAIDTTVPHSARVWNYWLGGKDNYEVDREMGRKVEEIFPGFVQSARMSRRFTGRAVRHLAGEACIRQFLDVGTGLPTADDTHPPFVESMRAYADSGAVPYRLRSPEQIRGFFAGLELVEPGLVAPYTWRPERENDIGSAEPIPGTGLAAVARKP